MRFVSRYIVIFVICCLPLIGNAQWSRQMYAQYSYYNYTDYQPFNQRIEDTGYDAELLEAAIFYETNRQRAKYGLPLLSFDYNLYVCAHNHSVDMVNYNFFSHESPVPGKYSMSDRLAQVGYSRHAAAENIAEFAIKSTYVEAARYVVADMWMKSPGHRANIMNSVYTHLGCGAALMVKGSFVYVRATQNFVSK